MQNCAAPHRIGKAVDSLELSVGGAESTAGNRQSTINNRQSRSASPALRTCGICTRPKAHDTRAVSWLPAVCLLLQSSCHRTVVQ